jgi:acetoin utilization protein AcuB
LEVGFNMPAPNTPELLKVADIMRRDVIHVNEDDSLALAEQLMLWNRVTHLPVMRASDARITGILGERELLHALRAHANDSQALATPVRAHMSTVITEIAPNANLRAALHELSQRGIDCLPVVDGNELVGLVTRSDVLRAVAAPRCAELTVEAGDSVASIMYPEPLAVREDDSLVTVAKRMVRARLRHACVVDGEGRVIGMLSDRDLRRVFGDPRLAQTAERDSMMLATLHVRDVMIARPYTISQEDTVQQAARALAESRVGALPVVDGHGHLRGIVSYIDVLDHFANPR